MKAEYMERLTFLNIRGVYMKNVKIGYQIYSARDDAEKDLLGTLKTLKALGYDGVELAGLYGKTADEFKAALDEAGIEAISAHVPLADIEKDMFKTISDYNKLGCKFIAVPYTDDTCRPGGKDFARTLQVMHKFGRLCKKAGMQLLYHNHDFEFEPFSGMRGLDFIYAALDAETLKTEIDTCWAKFAGLNPAEYVLSYTGRAPIVHLKDFVGEKGDKNPYALIGMADDSAKAGEIKFEFRPVGYGCQDMKSVCEAAVQAGAGWLIVEQDNSDERPALEAAKMSREYLNSIGY